MTSRSPQTVIRTYLLITGLYNLSASLIWSVNTLFLLGAGLTISEAFIANAAYTAGMVIFEIPTGVLADTAGRRASFLISTLVMAGSTLLYLLAYQARAGIVIFSAVSVLIGLGWTFYSGAVEAWLVDALKHTGYSGSLDTVFARGAVVTGGVMLIGSIGGGILGTIDLALPYAARAALLLIVCAVAYFLMRELGYTPRALTLSRIPAEMRSVARASVAFGWKEPHLRMIMLVGLLTGGFGIWAFYAWQPHFLALFGDPNAVYIAGVVTALLSIASIVGSALTGPLLRRVSRRTTLLIAGTLIYCVTLIGVGLTDNFYAAVTLFLIGMGITGMTTPIRQSFIHQLTPSEQRATVVSVDSMFANTGGIVEQVALGRIAQTISIPAGYIIGGGVTLLAVPLLWLLRRRQSPVDHVRSEAATP